MPIDFAQALREITKSHNLSDSKISEAYKQVDKTRTMTDKTIYNWRTGKIRPNEGRFSRLIEILRFLEVDEAQLNQLKKTYEINTPKEPAQPTNDSDITLERISEFRKNFIERKIFCHFCTRYPSPMILLAQDTKYIPQLLSSLAQQKENYTKVYSIVLTQYTDESNFYQILGRNFDLCVDNRDQFASQLCEKLSKFEKPCLCIISRFEKLQHEIASQQIAGVLRSITERMSNRFHLILVGGKELNALMWSSSASSLLNHCMSERWVDWKAEEISLFCGANIDVPEQSVAEKLIEISGAHLQLLEKCLALYNAGFEISQYKVELSQLDFLTNKFAEIIKNLEKQKELYGYLQQTILKELPLNPRWELHLPLLKELYWENLITKREEGLCWRCEAIRLAGLSVCEENNNI